MAPRPASLGRAPAKPWRASGLAQDVSSVLQRAPVDDLVVTDVTAEDATERLIQIGRRDAGTRSLEVDAVGGEALAGAQRPRGHETATRHAPRVLLAGHRPLVPVAEGRLHSPDGLHERTQLVGLERGAVVGAGQRPVEREVLLD